MATPTVTVNLSVSSTTGAQQTPPATLNANLIAIVAQVSPGYTVLPGTLIEDLSSTATYAIALMDAAAVETINSLDPSNANPWLLLQLGQIYGVPMGLGSNTSAYVVFSGTVGFQVVPGFIVTDGSYQYVVQDGVAIGSGGSSPACLVVASLSGSWPIPANTITGFVSSKPTDITLTVTNPNAGTPATTSQTEGQYRAQVLAAGLAAGTGFASLLKTMVGVVGGVQERLISVRLIVGRGWEIIVGGSGDPYAIANAIFNSGVDLSTIVGSLTTITAATLSSPCVITTNIDHGFTNGQPGGVVISGATGLTSINGTWTVTTTGFAANQFSIAHDTTAGPAYTGGGTVTPNSGLTRNVTVSLNDPPDTYEITFVAPPAQAVTVQLTWNTTSPNFVSDAAVAQLGAPAIAAYVNSVAVGQPINVFAMEQAFVAAVVSLFGNNAALISQMTWTVSINGIETSPGSGTFLIVGDAESFFTCLSTAVTVTQG